jgi:hypothetical protein
MEEVGKRRSIFTNKRIVIWKLVTACLAFFAYCLFFFDNKDYFIEDFRSMRILFPLIFLSGIVFVIVYIANLVGRIESKTIWRADRLYALYQFVFTAVMVAVVCRSFFADLVVDKLAVIILAVTGIMTLCTPPIRDNNNDEF